MEKVIVLFIGMLFAYIAYDVGIKGNFKFTHIKNEWLKKLSTEELNKIKRGFGISYLLIGFITMILIPIPSTKLLLIWVVSMVIITLNLFRLAIKYIYCK